MDELKKQEIDIIAKGISSSKSNAEEGLVFRGSSETIQNILTKYTVAFTTKKGAYHSSNTSILLTPENTLKLCQALNCTPMAFADPHRNDSLSAEVAQALTDMLQNPLERPAEPKGSTRNR